MSHRTEPHLEKQYICLNCNSECEYLFRYTEGKFIKLADCVSILSENIWLFIHDSSLLQI